MKSSYTKSYKSFKQLIANVRSLSPINISDEDMGLLLYIWYNDEKECYSYLQEKDWNKTYEILDKELNKICLSSEQFYEYYMKWAGEDSNI